MQMNGSISPSMFAPALYHDGAGGDLCTGSQKPGLESLMELPELSQERTRTEGDARTAGAKSTDAIRPQGSIISRTRLSLRGRRHISFRGNHGLSVRGLQQRQQIAKDWSIPRKRFVASVACINTAFIGLIVGIYVSLLT